MNSNIFKNILRSLFIVFVQVLIFKQISFSLSDLAYAHFFIYPLAILILPIKTPRGVLLIAGFIVGLLIDIFYDSLGVHAATLVFTSYIRNLILAFLEPYEGYNIDDLPTFKKMGAGWMISYLSIALFIHCFVYFSIESFSYVYFFEIFLNTIATFIVSILVMLISLLIFRPKY